MVAIVDILVGMIVFERAATVVNVDSEGSNVVNDSDSDDVIAESDSDDVIAESDVIIEIDDKDEDEGNAYNCAFFRGPSPRPGCHPLQFKPQTRSGRIKQIYVDEVFLIGIIITSLYRL